MFGGEAMKQNKIFIYGRHALMEALLNAPYAVDKVFLAKNNKDKNLREAIDNANVSLSPLGSGKNTQGVKNSDVHQGVIGRISLDKLVLQYDDFIRKLEIGPDNALVLLGEIEDPHNVGAIIRSSAGFGASGVLMPRHNQSPVTGAVVKVSAGMAFRVPIVEIPNVNMTIRDLKDKGFRIYGLDGEAVKTINEESYDEPSVFIIGNEAKGIRQKTRELCDELLAIPTHSQLESLNVAASLAVTLFDWSSKRPGALR